MKRPKRKDIIIDENDCRSLCKCRQDGYNQACDDWKKWLDTRSKELHYKIGSVTWENI